MGRFEGFRLTFSAWIVLLVTSGCGGGGDGDATYTLSGTMYCAAGNFVDSDINDAVAAANVPNNSMDEDGSGGPQWLIAPAAVGGFVDRGTDPYDFFKVDLAAGDIVRIAIPHEADGTIRRIGLCLYGADKTAMQASSDAAPHTAFDVVAPGTYYIEVSAAEGAASYRLMAGRPSALGDAPGPAAEFVPGEVLVRLKNASAHERMDAHGMPSPVRDLGMRPLTTLPGGWMHLQVTDMRTTSERLNLPSFGSAVRRPGAPDAAEARRRDTWRIVQALRRRPEIAHAQPNFIRRPALVPGDPLTALQWNLDLIQLPAAWDLTTGDGAVIVAVLDTGILSRHPDLQGKLLEGYDFIGDDINSADEEPGIDDNPEDPGDNPGASGYHGTHVAGIAAAGFGNGIGVAGVGGNTRILPVRVLGRDGGTDVDIAQAILWVAGRIDTDGTAIEGGVPQADIINLSMGGTGAVDPLRDVLGDAVNAAMDAGIIVIAAAGNTGSSTLVYPAAYDRVVSVAAVDAAGRRAAYSNFGSTIDLAAPGGDLYADLQPDGYADGILSTLGSDASGAVEYTYGYYQGTSMAVPHVAGVAALMKALRPGLSLTHDDFRAYVEANLISADLGAPGKDDFYGHGLIDAHRAVAAAVGTPPPTVASVMPKSVRLVNFQSTAWLDLSQIGSGDLSLAAPAFADADWLDVVRTPGQTPETGDFGQYTLTVDRQGLAGGVRTGIVSFVFPDQTLDVPVTLDVLPHAAASASTQYISLIEAQTGRVVQQIPVTPKEGVYAFTFTNVPAGSYFIMSGSDLDDDDWITDSGEAVGAYPSLAEYAPIQVQGHRTGLDFVVGFQQWALVDSFDAISPVQRFP